MRFFGFFLKAEREGATLPAAAACGANYPSQERAISRARGANYLAPLFNFSRCNHLHWDVATTIINGATKSPGEGYFVFAHAVE